MNKMQSEMADFASGASTWRTGRNIRVVFDSGLFPPLYGNMTSSRKPEVHNLSHCHRRRTEPRSQVSRTENLDVWLWADRQTNTHSLVN